MSSTNFSSPVLHPAPSVHRRTWHRLAVAGVMWVLGMTGCSANWAGEHTLHVDGGKLQQKLNDRFPMHKEALGLFAVTLSQPRLHFDAPNNRLGTELVVDVPSAGGWLPAIHGTALVTYGLRFDTTDYSVRMTQVHVQALDLRQGGAPANPQLGRALVAMGERAFNDYPIYRFSASDLAKARQYHYLPKTIAVRHDGLDVTLAPAP